MTVLLSEKFIVGFAIKVFLCTSSFTLMQSSDIVLLPHFITVDSAKSRRKTAKGRTVEDGSILDAVVGFTSEGRTDHAVNDAGTAVS